MVTLAGVTGQRDDPACSGSGHKGKPGTSTSLKEIVRRGLNIVSIRTAILLYHRVADLEQDPWGLAVRPENFAEHLQVLRNIGVIRLRTVEPSAVKPFGSGCSVAITFDDGYADNYTQALPLLERFETPATFFIATGPLRKRIPFWWDELQSLLLDANLPEEVCVKVGGQQVAFAPKREERPIEVLWRVHSLIQQLDLPERREALDKLREAVCLKQVQPFSGFPMTEEQLQKMSASPFIEIGAHTVTHPKLSALSPKRQFEEIEGSRTYLEALLGKQITSFAYPYGASEHFTKGHRTSGDGVRFSKSMHNRACRFSKTACWIPNTPPYCPQR